MAASLYISYSSGDRAYVDRLAGHLALAGIATWHAENRADDDATILPQLEDCAAVLVVVSAATAGSVRVSAELEYANAHRKPVIWLMLDRPTQQSGGTVRYGVPNGVMPGQAFLDDLRGQLPPPPPPAPTLPAPAAPAPGGPADEDRLWIDSELSIEWGRPLPEEPAGAPPMAAPPAPLPPVGAPPAPRPPRAPGAAPRAAQPPAPSAAAPPSAPTPPVLDGRHAAAEDTRLEFAAAYRRWVEHNRPHPVLFFVHRPDGRDLVRQLIDRRTPQLGGTPTVSVGEAAQAVRTGTTLSIVPSVLGATFEPNRIDVVAGDSVRELTFSMTVPEQTPAGFIDGYIDIFVGPLIIGQVPVAFEVHAATTPTVPKQGIGEELLEVASATVFDTIFVSYSHKDAAVVDLCVLTYENLGVRVLIDKQELRSGQDWRAQLESMIRDSDIFQLYWSSAAASSTEVDHEWRLALDLGRNRFVRPLYWENPLPSLPEPLRHLHFSKIDVKSLRRSMKGDGLFRRAMKVFGAR